MSEPKTATTTETLLEVEIDAPPERVWRTLTEEIGDWWPAEFYTGGKAETRTFQLEAQPGGRMIEEWAEGGGVLWGTVIGVTPGESLQVIGTTFPDWGGPSHWFGSWSLQASGEGTALRFRENAVGAVSEANRAEMEKGWEFLFGGALKAHAEGRPAPSWGE